MVEATGPQVSSNVSSSSSSSSSAAAARSGASRKATSPPASSEPSPAKRRRPSRRRSSRLATRPASSSRQVPQTRRSSRLSRQPRVNLAEESLEDEDGYEDEDEDGDERMEPAAAQLGNDDGDEEEGPDNDSDSVDEANDDSNNDSNGGERPRSGSSRGKRRGKRRASSAPALRRKKLPRRRADAGKSEGLSKDDETASTNATVVKQLRRGLQLGDEIFAASWAKSKRKKKLAYESWAQHKSSVVSVVEAVESRTVTIAFFGDVRQGKSHIINALLAREGAPALLQSRVSETSVTAVPWLVEQHAGGVDAPPSYNLVFAAEQEYHRRLVECGVRDSSGIKYGRESAVEHMGVIKQRYAEMQSLPNVSILDVIVRLGNEFGVSATLAILYVRVCTTFPDELTHNKSGESIQLRLVDLPGVPDPDRDVRTQRRCAVRGFFEAETVEAVFIVNKTGKQMWSDLTLKLLIHSGVLPVTPPQSADWPTLVLVHNLELSDFLKAGARNVYCDQRGLLRTDPTLVRRKEMMLVQAYETAFDLTVRTSTHASDDEQQRAQQPPPSSSGSPKSDVVYEDVKESTDELLSDSFTEVELQDVTNKIQKSVSDAREIIFPGGSVLDAGPIVIPKPGHPGATETLTLVESKFNFKTLVRDVAVAASIRQHNTRLEEARKLLVSMLQLVKYWLGRKKNLMSGHKYGGFEETLEVVLKDAARLLPKIPEPGEELLEEVVRVLPPRSAEDDVASAEIHPVVHELNRNRIIKEVTEIAPRLLEFVQVWMDERYSRLIDLVQVMRTRKGTWAAEEKQLAKERMQDVRNLVVSDLRQSLRGVNKAMLHETALELGMQYFECASAERIPTVPALLLDSLCNKEHRAGAQLRAFLQQLYDHMREVDERIIRHLTEEVSDDTDDDDDDAGDAVDAGDDDEDPEDVEERDQGQNKQQQRVLEEIDAFLRPLQEVIDDLGAEANQRLHVKKVSLIKYPSLREFEGSAALRLPLHVQEDFDNICEVMSGKFWPSTYKSGMETMGMNITKLMPQDANTFRSELKRDQAAPAAASSAAAAAASSAAASAADDSAPAVLRVELTPDKSKGAKSGMLTLHGSDDDITHVLRRLHELSVKPKFTALSPIFMVSRRVHAPSKLGFRQLYFEPLLYHDLMAELNAGVSVEEPHGPGSLARSSSAPFPTMASPASIPASVAAAAAASSSSAAAASSSSAAASSSEQTLSIPASSPHLSRSSTSQHRFQASSVVTLSSFTFTLVYENELRWHQSLASGKHRDTMCWVVLPGDSRKKWLGEGRERTICKILAELMRAELGAPPLLDRFHFTTADLCVKEFRPSVATYSEHETSYPRALMMSEMIMSSSITGDQVQAGVEEIIGGSKRNKAQRRLLRSTQRAMEDDDQFDEDDVDEIEHMLETPEKRAKLKVDASEFLAKFGDTPIGRKIRAVKDSWKRAVAMVYLATSSGLRQARRPRAPTHRVGGLCEPPITFSLGALTGIYHVGGKDFWKLPRDSKAWKKQRRGRQAVRSKVGGVPGKLSLLEKQTDVLRDLSSDWLFAHQLILRRQGGFENIRFKVLRPSGVKGRRFRFACGKQLPRRASSGKQCDCQECESEPDHSDLD